MMGRGRVVLLAGVVVGIALVVAGGLAAMRVRQIAQDAQERVAAIRESVAADMASPPVDSADAPAGAAATETIRKYCEQAGALERDLRPVTQLAGVAGPAAQVLGQLPTGERAAALLALAQAGGEITTATRTACEALDPVLEAQLSGADITTLIATLADARDRLREATARLRAAQERLAGVDERQLDEGPRKLLVELRDRLPAAGSRLALLAEVPGLLGFEGRRTYLILGQNTDELWPTGGFIGTAGVVTVDRGKVVRRDYGSSLLLKLPPDLMVPPPAPLRPGMEEGYWHLYGSNWWPDFPSAARQAQYFYELTEPKDTIAGVIGIDQHLIGLLVGVTGPIEIPEYGEVVTAENARDRLDYQVHVVGVGQAEEVRKGFVQALFPRLVEGILQLPRDRLRDLNGALQRGFEEQHLQFWVDDTRAQEVVGRLGWDGRMLVTFGDYLFPVSTNVGANKINRAVEQALEYEVSQEPDGRLVGRAVLRVDNRHKPGEGEPERETIYRDYLRIYVPAQSELLSAQGFASEPQTTAECGRTAFAGLVVVPAGQERRVELTYRLPASLRAASYNLVLQKQSGLAPFPVQFRGSGPLSGQVETRLASHQVLGLDGQQLTTSRWTPALHVPPARLACEVHTAAPRTLQPPVGVAIDKLGVDADIVGLGAESDGTLQSPPNGDLVGWYIQSARPGAVGNVVMSGHVDWEKRLAVFWRLNELKKGDRITVVAQGGERHSYQVEWVKSYDAATAPLMEILGGTSERWLTLITCGGTFNPITRDYAQRLVVRARLATGG